MTSPELANMSLNIAMPVPKECLSFRAGNGKYIDILKVQEISGYALINRLAIVPAFILGLSNPGSAIVPINSHTHQVQFW